MEEQMTDAQQHWRNHREEVAGNGNFPLRPDYIDEFIKGKARSSEGWAIAYALLQLGYRITDGANSLVGVDDFNGQMRIGAALEAIAKAMKPKLGNGEAQ
jgi:hypothetical protein